MKEKILYALWGALYILCTALSFVPHPQGIGKVFLVLTALIFFLPGAILLYDGLKAKNRKAVLRIRWISLASLVLTLILIILNVLSVHWSQSAGNTLHQILALVSSPMLCSQYWIGSIFLWACLLVASMKRFPKDKK